MAANIFNGSTDSNWGTAANWSLGVVPVFNDGHTVTFNATSPNCTVNASNREANHIDFTGYTNVVTMSFSISSYGTVTFQANQASRIAGSAQFVIQASGTITSNGGTWPNNFTTGGTSMTVTLADNLTVSGLVSFFAGVSTALNGNNLICNGGLSGLSGTITGTTTIQLAGTGTWLTSGTGSIRTTNLTIKSTANITFGAAISYAGTLTVEAGAVVVTTGNTFTCATFTAFITTPMGTTTNGFNNIVCTGTNGISMGSNLYINGTLTLGGATYVNGAFNTYCLGDVALQSGATITGTGHIQVVGTGTFGSISGVVGIANNVTFNTAGTITFSDWCYRSNTLTFTAGTFIWGANVALIFQTGNPILTINTNIGTIPRFNVGGAAALTSVTVNGTNGFTADILYFQSLTNNTNLILKFGNTYVANNIITVTTTGALHNKITSNTGGSKVSLIFLKLTAGLSDIGFLDFTDIDNSLGKTLLTYKGVIANCNNIKLLPVVPATITT